MRSKEVTDELVKRHMRYESADAIARFIELMDQGFDPFCASVAATGDVPGSNNTDRALMHGRLNDQERCNKVWQGRAKKAGSIANGRTYMPSLARFPNDPGAWVDGYGDMKRQAIRAGKSIEGVYEAPPPPPPKMTALSEQAINSHLRREVMDDPGLATDKKRLKKLREEIVTKHCPKWKKKLLKG